MNTPIITENYAYVHNTHTLFQFESATKIVTASNPEFIQEAKSFGELAPWGDSNTFPQDALEMMKKNNTLSWTSRQIVNSIYASGLRVKKKVLDPLTNAFILQDFEFPEWNAFLLRNTKLHSYQMQKLRDLRTFLLSPTQFLFENGKIVGLKTHQTQRFRYNLQNESGVKEYGYLNAQWEKGKKIEDETTLTFSLIEPDFDAINNLKLLYKEGEKYLYIIKGACEEEYYPSTEWQTILESGWLEISNNEPRFIMAVIQNQAIVNYIIKIKDWYWRAKYGKDWDSWKADKRKQKREETIKEFSDMVGGSLNAGKTMIADVITQLNLDLQSEVKGKTSNFKDFQEAWELVTQPQNTITGSLKEPADTARKEIMLAQGLDVSSFGSVPDQNTQGGSGKSQSMNILMITSEYLRQLSVEDLNFIRDFNGWDSSMTFTYELPVMQTLANVPPAQRDLQIKK
ncbi:hypothetical protein LV89_01989 [Arcicella aurantiaca]|uniref:SPP1 Gp6-like portal protein n=1 Tax=Arcicella aurantiaca TaxID=591202 RepID=A0A316EBV7_9BACT|nr:hypothetical protein [Arcicella aurantiaca]PWK27174.1 hypothetical protein LV89_01989 [Arcicella aurantiaca]